MLTHDCAVQVEPFRFTVDFDAPENFKPLRPHARQDWVKVPMTYPKHEEEFFDIIKDCAKGIDTLTCTDTRIKLNKKLNKIFINRHKGNAMALFKELFLITLNQQRSI